jgi:hypothetical protein
MITWYYELSKPFWLLVQIDVLYMFMIIYIYIYIYTYTYTYICTHKHTHTHIQTVSLCIYTYIYICIKQVHTYIQYRKHGRAHSSPRISRLWKDTHEPTYGATVHKGMEKRGRCEQGETYQSYEYGVQA